MQASALARREVEARSFALLIGVEKYQSANNGFSDLHCVRTDVEELEKALVETGFPNAHIIKLLDEQVTLDKVAKAFADLATWVQEARNADWNLKARLFVYLAGHGVGEARVDGATVLALWGTTAKQSGLTGLDLSTVQNHLNQVRAEQVVLVLDCCHSAGALEGNRASEGATDHLEDVAKSLSQSEGRTILCACMRRQLAWERKPKDKPDSDSRQMSVFGKVLIDGIRFGATAENGIVSSLRLREYLEKEVPAECTREWGSGNLHVQNPWCHDSGQSIPIAYRPEAFASDVDASWSRPDGHPANHLGALETSVTVSQLLPDFAGKRPAPEREQVARCLVLSAAGDDTTLATHVHNALLGRSQVIERRMGRRLDSIPVVVEVASAFADVESYRRTVRALCRMPIAVFDTTDFSRPLMLLLGVRSVARRGITVCSIGGAWKIGDPIELPFNSQEIRFISHSSEQTQPIPVELLKGRILEGLDDLNKRPDLYLDLPAYDGVRRLGYDPQHWTPVSEVRQIFVLCPFDTTYTQKNFQGLQAALKARLDSQSKEGDGQPGATVDRVIDLRSSRLVSQTLYGQIRLNRLCVIDLTSLNASVLFECGVRLAVNDISPITIIEKSNRAKVELSDPAVRAMLRLLDPIEYQVGKASVAAEKILERFKAYAEPANGLPAPSSALASGETYRLAADWIDVVAEHPDLEIDTELSRTADLLSSATTERTGNPAALFPGNELLGARARAAALERRLAAWLFLDGRFGPDRLRTDETRRVRYQWLGNICITALRKTGSEADATLAERIESQLGKLAAIATEGQP